MDLVMVTQTIDGESVQTPMTPYQLLRAQQAREEQARVAALAKMNPPRSDAAKSIPLGVMSRTLLSSSYIKMMLPAKIRHKNLNDVVFVGEDFVHLKQATANGTLRHIATKSDFGGKILAARVFGSPQKTHQNAHAGTPIKRKDVRAHRRSTAGEDSEQLPPEMLVLTLDTKSLIFLWACPTSNGHIKFHHRTLRLPGGKSRIERPGPFLAVAPNFRAIAIAALEGQFVFCKTQTLVAWREHMREYVDANSTPVAEEITIPTNGRIIHMDFLAPSAEQEDPHVIAILVIAHSGRTKITCYDWVADHEPSSPTLRAERVNIDTEDNNPSLLVPLRRSPAFLLVFNGHISAYGNILSGTSQCYRTQIPPEMLAPVLPGDSNSSPIWVQWESAERNNEYPKEAFYIAREDGKVLYVEVGRSMTLEISDAGSLPQTIDRAFASLQVDSDTLNRLQPDIFAAPGVSSDGYVSKLGSWVSGGVNLPHEASYSFETLEKIPNWAPTMDLTTMPTRRTMSLPRTMWSQSSASANPSASTESTSRRSILLGHGRAPYGSITEVRRGIEAKIDTHCQGMKGCNGLWIIDHGSEETLVEEESVVQQYASILCSFPHESLALRVTYLDGVYSIQDIANENEIDADGLSRHETLHLSIISDLFMVQVIHGEARVISRAGLVLLDRLALDGAALVAAAHPQLRQLAIAYRGTESFALETVELLEAGKFGVRHRYGLPSDPTCVEVLDVEGVPHVLVGTTDSSIRMIRISQTGLEPVLHCDLNRLQGPQYIAAVCESAVMLRYSEKHVLLCGLRDGSLASFALRTQTAELSIDLMNRITLGTSSVRLWPCITNPSVAFASCGADFVQVHHRTPNSSLPIIDSIWFTDINNECYQQQEIMAFGQLPLRWQQDDADQDLASLIFTVSGDNLLLSRIECETGYKVPLPQGPQAVPRKWTIGATPSTVTFSERLQRILVSVSEPREVQVPPDGYRTINTGLQVVKLDDEGGATEDIGDLTPRLETLVSEEGSLRPYERICSIVEWIAKNKMGHPYHHVVVGTAHQEYGKPVRGRIMHYQIVQNKLVRKRRTSWYPGAIRSISLFSPNVFIYGYGKIVVVDEYSIAENDFIRLAESTLKSDVVSISCQPPWVYVSTAAHSLSCYEFKELSSNVATLSGRDGILIPVYTESRTRLLTHHTHIANAIPDNEITSLHESTSEAIDNTRGKEAEDHSDETVETRSNQGRTLILLADKVCTVSGVLHPAFRSYPSEEDYGQRIPALFEAHLSRSVIRLQQDAFRTPWARPSTGPAKGVLIDDVVGVCTDGTIYNFSILSAEATLLLRYIQNLIRAQEHRCMTKRSRPRESDLKRRVLFMGGFLPKQGSGSNPAGDDDNIITPLMIDPLEGLPAPKKWHVDADVLVRYLDGDINYVPFDEENALFVLLTTETSEGVWRQFSELAGFLRLAGEEGRRGPEGLVGGGEEDRRRFARSVQDWVRDVTREML
ncbi:uncharacterized protein EI97DRAFT_172847 [Westerdykella ornata]|uniref:Uncharacterized protein n=1 Tax=Westerdykella ornata TaxID=318751 RepID=A0A6A6JT87_WESOR|nr:uncharacterized protein EI97DRAFT_172847 [Westerdykella ornata]KAF2279333.1 hypothetical protein EI97DRAFT_172847 [Westerdykella ornata]